LTAEGVQGESDEVPDPAVLVTSWRHGHDLAIDQFAVALGAFEISDGRRSDAGGRAHCSPGAQRDAGGRELKRWFGNSVVITTTGPFRSRRCADVGIPAAMRAEATMALAEIAAAGPASVQAESQDA